MYITTLLQQSIAQRNDYKNHVSNDKKKMSLLFAKKKKNNFFFKYIDEALLQKSDVAMVLSLLTIEKSELCENFKSTVILPNFCDLKVGDGLSQEI